MTVYPTGPQDGIKYTLTAPDGSVATFNDPTDPNYVGFAKWTGLDGPDIRESLEDRSGDHGAIQGINYRGRRPVVGNIEILGTSPADRNAKWARFRRASNCLDADGTLDFTPDGGLASRVYVRLNQPPRRADDSSGMLAKAQVGLVAANPDIVSQALRSAAGTTAVVTCTNQGDGIARPTTTVTATAGAAVSVTNQTTGESLIIPSLNVSTYVADYVAAYGSFGSSNGQFNLPFDLDVDASGNVYVADYSNHRVQKFNSSGVHQLTFGSFGTGNGQFNGPRSISVDSAGSIFVGDYSNNRIQEFNSAGTYVAQWALNTPAGLCHDASDNLYAVSGGANFLAKYNSSNVHQGSTGTTGSGNGQFSGPVDVECDTAGNAFVVDYGNRRVQKFNSALAYQSQFGSTGLADEQLYGPLGIAIDSANTIYVTDYSMNRLNKFNSSGVFQGYFAMPASVDVVRGVSVHRSGTSPIWFSEQGHRIHRLNVSATRTAILDHATRTITIGGYNAYSALDVAASTWWGLRPDGNNVLVAGATSWSMEWRDTWL